VGVVVGNVRITREGLPSHHGSKILMTSVPARRLRSQPMVLGLSSFVDYYQQSHWLLAGSRSSGKLGFDFSKGVCRGEPYEGGPMSPTLHSIRSTDAGGSRSG